MTVTTWTPLPASAFRKTGRVALGEVVVDGDYVDSLAGECVQKDGKGRHEGLSLSGGHLGYLSLVQDDTSDELHVVVDHVPGYRVTSGYPSMVPIGLVALDTDVIVLGAELAVHVGGGHFDDLFLLEPANRAWR